jgi:hypothetical protein
MAIQCPKCGSGNRGSARFCSTCGGPLTQTQGRSSVSPPPDLKSIPQPTGEAMAHYNWAKGMMLGIEDDDPARWREVADRLALAIQEAGGVFPAAHASLGFAMVMMDNTRNARREFSLAVQQDDNNVMARAMLILLELESLGTSNPPLVGGWSDLLVVGIGAATTRRKLAGLRAQINGLAKAFRDSVEQSDNVKDWIWASELMLQVYDAIRGIVDRSQAALLPQAVVDAPWDTVDIPTDLGQDVADIRRRAEDRIGLAR